MQPPVEIRGHSEYQGGMKDLLRIDCVASMRGLDELIAKVRQPGAAKVAAVG